MKELKTDYEEVETLFSIWQFMFKHIQNIDKVFNDVKCAEITVAEEKLQWFMIEVKIVKFVCDHERHCEGVGFGGRFGEQQVIDGSTTTRFMRPASITRICIDLNRWSNEYMSR